jgi:hypothetical protein
MQLAWSATGPLTSFHTQHNKFLGVIHEGCLPTAQISGRPRLKRDGTRAETRFHLLAKRTSPFKSAGASVQSTTGSRGVRNSGINDSNAGYTMFRGSVKGTGDPLQSPVSPSLPLPCITMCHYVSTGLYHRSVNASVTII